MIDWILKAPVWFQTPLVVILVLALCAGLAWVFIKLMWLVLPATPREQALLAKPDKPQQPTNPHTGHQANQHTSHTQEDQGGHP